MAERTEVYGRGTLEWVKEGPGQCVARLRVDLPRGPDGRRRRYRFTLKGTRREIERERIRILHELHTGALRARQPQTVAEYLAYWIEHAVAPGGSERYAVSCRQCLDYYVAPYLGQVRLSDLTPLAVQELYARLRREGRRRRHPGQPAGLSETTVNGVHRVLNRALEQAVVWQILDANPCRHVAAPKPAKRKPVILSREQVARVLAAATHPQLRLYVMIAACTGMRRGEVLGLRWSDVDLERRLFTIEQTYVDTGRRLVFKPPKTEAGARPLRIPGMLAETLAAHREEQERRKALLGGAYQDHGLVVCWEDGRPIEPRRLYRPLTNLLRRLGLPENARLHDLRHSHATHLLQDNVHAKAVSERLGHRDVETTLNIYSHVLADIQQQAAEATDRAMRAALGGAQPDPQGGSGSDGEDGTKMGHAGRPEV